MIKLTKRQIDILGHLRTGGTNVSIGEELGISEHTVKVHIWRLFRRIGVKNRGSAVAWWAENGPHETIDQAYARGVQDGRNQILGGIEKMSALVQSI